MTCFIAHMKKKGYFDEMGIEVTKENSKELEREIARIVGREGRGCPDIWKETKIWLQDREKKEKLYAGLRSRF